MVTASVSINASNMLYFKQSAGIIYYWLILKCNWLDFQSAKFD